MISGPYVLMDFVIRESSRVMRMAMAKMSAAASTPAAMMSLSFF
jgi:hypothetical protein